VFLSKDKSRHRQSMSVWQLLKYFLCRIHTAMFWRSRSLFLLTLIFKLWKRSPWQYLTNHQQTAIWREQLPKWALEKFSQREGAATWTSSICSSLILTASRTSFMKSILIEKSEKLVFEKYKPEIRHHYFNKRYYNRSVNRQRDVYQ